MSNVFAMRAGHHTQQHSQGLCGGKPPAGWLTPSSLLLPRSRVFYSESFASAPGLPMQRVFRMIDRNLCWK